MKQDIKRREFLKLAGVVLLAGCATTKVRSSFVCSKCGNCCRTMPPKYWRNAEMFRNPPNPADKKPEPDVSDIIVNHNGKWCEMLGPDNLCALWKKFGKGAIPQICRDWPANNEQLALCNELSGRF